MYEMYHKKPWKQNISILACDIDIKKVHKEIA